MSTARTNTTRRWVVAERTQADLVEQLLANRGITDKERFFNPDYERDGHDPFLMPNMQTAVDRILTAVKAGETIAVYADYDADGIPGGAVLTKMLRILGATVLPYVPDREKEGYGLNEPALQHLKTSGVTLIITVDLGITNHTQVTAAKQLGIDVIVTDHHHVDEPRIPTDAVALVHPALPGSTYPFHGLAGGGVAWKLVQALQQATGNPDVGQLKWWFELPAISTVCDIVPMSDENRMIVHYGLKVLMQTRNPGLKALYKAAGITPDTINEWTIGFQIGPRLNAPGRVDHASAALELLLTDDEQRAAVLAAQIELQNQERQAALERIVDEASALIDRDKLDEQPAIVLLGDAWPAGLIGLAAGRIVERYHRPVILLGRDGDGKAKGSGRSISRTAGEFNLLEGISAQKELLVSYGGHERAAGLQLSEDDFVEFQRRFIEFAASRLDAEALMPTERVDAVLKPEEVTDDLVTDLLRFAPFGPGNPRPRFVIAPLTVSDVRTVGASGKHLKLRFKEGPSNGLEAIGFGLGERASECTVGTKLAALGTLEFNEWNGTQRIQLKLDDLKSLDAAKAEGVL
ncbi:single-stranded-DNA-specific exonuclease RecJ [Candidatus Berkelbacteria bacterium]|nr:single-stranded-DNA-specific exonuclease RecJ [Candidatus Berkelbacteria bacterium]